MNGEAGTTSCCCTGWKRRRFSTPLEIWHFFGVGWEGKRKEKRRKEEERRRKEGERGGKEKRGGRERREREEGREREGGGEEENRERV